MNLKRGNMVADNLVDVVRKAKDHTKQIGFPKNPVTVDLRRNKRFVHKGVELGTAHRASDGLCDIMAGLILLENYTSGLEVGTLFGYSSLHLAEAFSRTRGRLWTVDLRVQVREWITGEKVVDIHEAAEKFISEAGFGEIVRFFSGDSNALLPSFFIEGEEFDFIFLDGSHSRYAFTLDLINAVNLLRRDGIIVLDDISNNIAVKEYHYGGPNSVLPAMFFSGLFEVIPLSSNALILRKKDD